MSGKRFIKPFNLHLTDQVIYKVHEFIVTGAEVDAASKKGQSDRIFRTIDLFCGLNRTDSTYIQFPRDDR